jgi:predicted DCC family thiol-disulfide oxidoreductase YuxK
MTSPLVDKPGSDTELLTVLYDGDCPLCRREIAHVQRLAASNPDTNLCFTNIGASVDNNAHPAGERELLLARFHVEKSDGTRLSGAQAFVAMWSRLPGWRLLARVAQLPGVTGLLEVLYKVFLKLRPGLQTLAHRLEKSAKV